MTRHSHMIPFSMFLFSSMFLAQRRLSSLGSQAKHLKTIYSSNVLGFSTSAVGIAYHRQTNYCVYFLMLGFGEREMGRELSGSCRGELRFQLNSNGITVVCQGYTPSE